MNDAQLLQAALLALTAQNVTGEQSPAEHTVYGHPLVLGDGWAEEIGAVCGNYESA